MLKARQNICKVDKKNLIQTKLVDCFELISCIILYHDLRKLRYLYWRKKTRQKILSKKIIFALKLKSEIGGIGD